MPQQRPTQTLETTPHISATQLAMFQKCGEQYRRRYIEGEKIPPGAAQIRGRGVHRARDVNLAQKIETGLDLAEEAVVEVAHDEVVGAFTGEVSLDEDQILEAVKGETIDAAIAFAEADYREYQRGIQPELVEAEIRVEVAGLGRNILGYLDVADIAGNVHDLKTYSRTPPHDVAERSDQLTIYALLYQTHMGKAARSVRIDGLVNLKAGIKPVEFVATRTPVQLDAVLKRLYVAVEAIDRGSFPPCNADVWWCSAKWCGYYGTCPYVAR